MMSWFHPGLLERSGCLTLARGCPSGAWREHPRAGACHASPRAGERRRAACETSEHADTDVADVVVLIEGVNGRPVKKILRDKPTTNARQVNSSYHHRV